MISLAIVSILLGLIFRFFSELTILEKRMVKAKEHILEKNNLEIKLTNIFSQITGSGAMEPIFYTEKDHLYFHFDNGIDPSPSFSSEVAAELFVDQNKDLILKTTPLEGNITGKVSREEILLQDAASLRFEFVKKENSTTGDQTLTYKTITSWDKENKNMPIEIKIYMKRGEENLNFAFFIPTVKPIITYISKEKR